MAANGDHVVVDVPPGDDDYVPVEQHVGGGQFLPPPPLQQQQFPPPGQQWWLPPWLQPQPWALPQHVQQHAPPPALPHKVHLTNFWTHQPAVWFTHAEALFQTYNVQEERMRFNLVLPTLSEDTLVRVAAIVTAPHLLATPYTDLKTRLLEVYQPDVWELSSQILRFRELGDQKPSQLMDSLLALLPIGEEPGLLFKTVFLDRLPNDVRTHVQGAARHQDCRELAAAADVIWRARNQKNTSTLAAVALNPVEEIADTVAALKIQPSGNEARGSGRRGGRGRGRGKPNSRGGGQPSQRKAYLCFKHARFGDAAWECEDPARCTAATSQPGN